MTRAGKRSALMVNIIDICMKQEKALRAGKIHDCRMPWTDLVKYTNCYLNQHSYR